MFTDKQSPDSPYYFKNLETKSQIFTCLLHLLFYWLAFLLPSLYIYRGSDALITDIQREICYLLKVGKYTGHWRDKRHRGSNIEGDRRAVNRAVTASSDIWAAKWLGACHFSSATAPRLQKDKKDSEIRFTSGLAEMDRNLPGTAFYVGQYIQRFAIQSLLYNE